MFVLKIPFGSYIESQVGVRSIRRLCKEKQNQFQNCLFRVAEKNIGQQHFRSGGGNTCNKTITKIGIIFNQNISRSGYKNNQENKVVSHRNKE